MPGQYGTTLIAPPFQGRTIERPELPPRRRSERFAPDSLAAGQEGPVALIGGIRERAPLRLAIEVESPTGRHYRWATDELLPDNAPADIAFSSTMPGGFEQFSATLPRKPARDYADLERLSTLRVRAPGGGIVGEYRLQTSPRTSGDQFTISPNAVGWQAALEDNKSIRITYVDRELSHWGPGALQLKLNLSAANGVFDAATQPDTTTGAPSLALEATGTWSAATPPDVEGWYDAGAGNPIGSVYYAWKKNGNINAGDASWSWQVQASTDDIATTVDSSGNLRAAGPGTGTLTTTGSNKRHVRLELSYATGPAGGEGTIYGVYFTCLAVYGAHGLTKRGAADATNAQGLFASDIVAHAVGRWAPELALTSAGESTIEPSGFVIPHIAFLELTTVGEIIKQATRFDLQDWAVWEGPTFWWHSRGARGRSWRARSGPAKLQETGPSADRLYNSIAVQYNDVTGVTRTVGPPGSGADTTDSSLADTDPANPANELGLTKRALLAMGTSTAAGAIQVGHRFLAEQKLLDRSGSATLTGHVQDDRGVLWPVSRVRAGDSIVFTDAADTSERRIVRANYSDRDKSSAVDLDAPPDALQALLERLSVVLVPLGLS